MKHTSMTEDDVNTFRCISAIDKSNGGKSLQEVIITTNFFAKINCKKPDAMPVKTI